MARKVAVRAGGRAASERTEAKRGRVRAFLLFTFAAGAASACAALMGSSLLSGVQTFAFDVHDNAVVETLGANKLFPAVPPQHRTVDVYDPAPPAKAPSTKPKPATTPSPSPRPTPSHRPRHSPTPCPTTCPPPRD